MRLFALLATLSLTLNAATLDPEELRVARVEAELPRLLAPLAPISRGTIDQHRLAADEQQHTAAITDAGTRLWRHAVARVQSGDLDDRPLYWNRLLVRREMKRQAAGYPQAQWQRQVSLDSFERASRGMGDIRFNKGTDLKILVTGFDPFFLDRHLNQSNPSGLAALALDGQVLNLDGRTAQVEAAMIPVRFEDFDRGLIEALLTPYLEQNRVDMLVTLSMGRRDFDLERFPALNRSAQAPGNRNRLTGATREAPLPPRLMDQALTGPQFVEFSLPVATMQRARGPWKINDNHRVATLERGEFEPVTLADLTGQTSVSGSGGGYLSNEISYRSLRLRHQLNSGVPTGHIHTPSIAQYDADTEEAIVAQIRAMLTQAIAAL
ncbi:hypothetical protein FCL40_10775 [Ferrimonas sediminicola]|uniref:Pyrrolidone-carboxylate peptidase (N-terminal pyroglutamyl peptidase) n=1 Tax=Ferrimonas sediminicola TaxID=2569538 RepID=A0A4U1BE78_9GAMM|nr:hypothetical protein [Ferrimonas sediminicola]TKB48634.1 hypothetical protein FCL40_10775 [Ferrimonas sediminicola]